MFSNTVITLRKKAIERTTTNNHNDLNVNFIYFFELSVKFV